MTDHLALQLIDIDKHFGHIHANAKVNLSVRSGTIHGIVGENGAGKSTLMSIIYGFYQADAGEIRLGGERVEIHDSRAAIAHGIGMVHQHFKLVENFTVLENVLLGAEGGWRISASRKKARAELAQLAHDYELQVDPDSLIEELSVGLQQRLEILKALYRGAQILILDEPTGVLAPSEADHLFTILRRLRDEGKTVILITHKLREIMAVTDVVSVMRGGKLIATKETSQVTAEQLAELMVGRKVGLQFDKKPVHLGKVALAVNNLEVLDGRKVKRVKNVSFEVRQGEIVGIAGVAGNGQTELLEALAGTRAIQSGQVLIFGRQVEANPRRLRDAGLGVVPEDRHLQGLILPFTLWENSSLGYHRRPEFGRGLLLDRQAMQANAQHYIDSYDIRPRNASLTAASFSGGNQQKIVLAREIEHDPSVLLVGQPTRGVDIGAIEFIHRRLIELRDQGKAILLISVELDEIRSLADRILVMFNGHIVGETSAEASERDIGLLMSGAQNQPQYEGRSV